MKRASDQRSVVSGQGGGGRLVVAGLMLGVVLLVLAVRMTMSEQVRETLDQKVARLATKAGEQQPFVGPAVTTGLAGVMLLAAGGAAWVGGRGARGGRLGKAGLIATIGAWGLVSALRAANRVAAVDGLCDVLMAMAAGWSVSVVCAEDVLGNRGRRVVVAGLAAILLVWVARGTYQKVFENPDTVAYYAEHRVEVLASQGIQNDPVKIQLYEARLHSDEVFGYVALSNVMATGLAGLLTMMTALLMGRLVGGDAPRLGGENDGRQGTRGAGGAASDGAELALWWICEVTGALAAALGVVVLIWTRSKGGTTVGLACILAVVAGALGWRRVVRWRRALVGAAVVLAVVGAGGVVAYGLRYDRLPSKSLMFRWHYWTAAARMIEQSPVMGIGLNNFGDYYLAYKRPSSPEDVKDPHSFFVRLAAEMGVPGAVLVGVLAAWMLLGGTRRAELGGDERRLAMRPMLVVGGLGTLAWWLVHYALAEVPDVAGYSAMLSVCSGLLAFAGWAAALQLAETVGAAGLRGVAVAATVGAAGMLVYDQVNMALVTGPVAMLFWVMMGLGDSYGGGRMMHEPPGELGAAEVRRGGWVARVEMAAGFGGAGVVVLMAVCVPLGRETASWDPAPLELKAMMLERAGQYGEALALLDQALALAPRSGDILMNRILLKRDRLHEPVAEDIRRMLELDRANARIRLSLALPESDLPAGERAAMLEEALRLDLELAPDEFKRLSAEERGLVEKKIVELRAAAVPR